MPKLFLDCSEAIGSFIKGCLSATFTSKVEECDCILAELPAATSYLERYPLLPLLVVSERSEASALKAELAARLRCALTQKERLHTLETQVRDLQENSLHDDLTGLFNRRGLLVRAEAEIAKASRHNEPMGLLVFDIDHFSSINDKYGHLVGDVVLKAIASTLSKTLRSYDCLARLGGDEFCVLLPYTTKTEATLVAEKIREAVAETSIQTQAGPISASVSIGLTCLSNRQDTFDSLFEAADTALYTAKGEGRNNVQIQLGKKK